MIDIGCGIAIIFFAASLFSTELIAIIKAIKAKSDDSQSDDSQQ